MFCSYAQVKLQLHTLLRAQREQGKTLSARLNQQIISTVAGLHPRLWLHFSDVDMVIMSIEGSSSQGTHSELGGSMGQLDDVASNST